MNLTFTITLNGRTYRVTDDHRRIAACGYGYTVVALDNPRKPVAYLYKTYLPIPDDPFHSRAVWHDGSRAYQDSPEAALAAVLRAKEGGQAA